MAFYVRLKKLRESPSAAVYSFSGDQRRFGEAELDKGSGEVQMIRHAPDDAGEHLYVRAAAKLRSEWRSGSVPETAEWAS